MEHGKTYHVGNTMNLDITGHVQTGKLSKQESVSEQLDRVTKIALQIESFVRSIDCSLNGPDLEKEEGKELSPEYLRSKVNKLESVLSDILIIAQNVDEQL
jgi:hypothetical protein